MKLYSKLSALGAVLVLTTAFASADTIINVNSGSGSTGYLGYSAVAGGPFAIQPGGVNNTPLLFPGHAYSIDPGVPVWAAAGPSSTWVSYDPNSGPTTINFGLTSSMIALISCGVSRQLSGAITSPALSSA